MNNPCLDCQFQWACPSWLMIQSMKLGYCSNGDRPDVGDRYEEELLDN